MIVPHRQPRPVISQKAHWLLPLFTRLSITSNRSVTRVLVSPFLYARRPAPWAIPKGFDIPTLLHMATADQTQHGKLFV
jgi:hypothetical protein